MGLVNRLVTDEGADATFKTSLELAHLIASKPSLCMRHDRMSTIGLEVNGGEEHKQQRSHQPCPFAVQGDVRTAMAREFEHGLISLTDLGKGLEEFIRRPRKNDSRL